MFNNIGVGVGKCGMGSLAEAGQQKSSSSWEIKLTKIFVSDG